MLYQQYGEQKGIGATAHLLSINGKNIAVDYGVGLENSPGFNKQFLPEGNFYKDKTIDMIIVTHSHFDHIGAIPRLIAEHPEAVVVMSRPTFESGKVILADSLNINRRALQANVIKEMTFTEVQFEAFQHSTRIELIEPEDLPCWIDFWPGWEIGFVPAGHHVGAMMVLISPPQDRAVLITGDVSAHHQEIVRGAMLPDDDFLDGFLREPGLVMITEATNGARKMAKPREDLVWELGEYLNEIHVRGGNALFPVFAQNRAANIAKMLVGLGFKPWVDGLARKLLPLELPETGNWLEEEKLFFFDEDDRERAAEQRLAVVRGEYGFAPIIAPSASLDKGFAVEHAVNLIGERNAIIFTGHIFPNSVAEKVKNAGPNTIITFERYKQPPVLANVKADVRHLDFTAHDYQNALVKRVNLAKPENLVVHHCDKDGLTGFWGAVLNSRDLADDRVVSIHHGRHMRALKF